MYMGIHGGEDMGLEAIVVESRIMEVVTEEVVTEGVVTEGVVTEEVLTINTESTIFQCVSSQKLSYSQLDD